MCSIVFISKIGSNEVLQSHFVFFNPFIFSFLIFVICDFIYLFIYLADFLLELKDTLRYIAKDQIDGLSK